MNASRAATTGVLAIAAVATTVLFVIAFQRAKRTKRDDNRDFRASREEHVSAEIFKDADATSTACRGGGENPEASRSSCGAPAFACCGSGGSESDSSPVMPVAVETPPPPLPITVMYGSTGGTARRCANALARRLLSFPDAAVSVQPMSDYDCDADTLEGERVVLAIISTYTDGSPPEAAAGFCGWLDDLSKDFRISAGLMAGAAVAVFGLGSTAYGGGEDFCAPARALIRGFAALGARPLLQKNTAAAAEGDDALGDLMSQFDEWTDGVLAAIASLQGGSDSPAEDAAEKGAEESACCGGANGSGGGGGGDGSAFCGSTSESGAANGGGSGGGEGGNGVGHNGLNGHGTGRRIHGKKSERRQGGKRSGGSNRQATGSGGGDHSNRCCGSNGDAATAASSSSAHPSAPMELSEEDLINLRIIEDEERGGSGSDDDGDFGSGGGGGGSGKSGDRSGMMDLEDLGAAMAAQVTEGAEAGGALPREMVTPMQRAALTKEGYKIIGSHSAVKLCRWTKHQLRGRGGCYKHTFYGITSYQCMEATPSLACANKCTFCWRHHKNPVGREWRWRTDDPAAIVAEAVRLHVGMMNQMRGVPGVVAERLQEAFTVRHCALSLVGEPIMYPRINELVGELHARAISTFLVTNAQFPDRIAQLDPVTQLYVSVDAATKDTLKAVDRPLFKDFWERFLGSLRELRRKRQRTVYRLTLLKGWNMAEVADYAALLDVGRPGLVEIKAVTFSGKSDASSLTMKEVPWHDEVVEFARALAASAGGRYGLACAHKHSCCVLLADKEKYCKEGKWHTWIDYDCYHKLVRRYHADGTPFSSEDYMAETPAWALFGSAEDGFDPQETRHYRNGKSAATAIEVRSRQSNA